MKKFKNYKIQNDNITAWKPSESESEKMNPENHSKKLEPVISERKPSKRHLARGFAMQALFQWHFSEETPEILIQEFIVDHLRDEKIDHQYFRSLVFGALKNIETIDETITPLLDRKISFLNPVELSVLRLAVYELQHCPEVPPKVGECGVECVYKKGVMSLQFILSTDAFIRSFCIDCG
ncbi:MAG: transcription antitermination protein NusB [Gammaproteobacteria bacterium]|nr:transcription antitermination protein NusB [Gammaproteobacteria bacterium]